MVRAVDSVVLTGFGSEFLNVWADDVNCEVGEENCGKTQRSTASKEDQYPPERGTRRLSWPENWFSWLPKKMRRILCLCLLRPPMTIEYMKWNGVQVLYPTLGNVKRLRLFRSELGVLKQEHTRRYVTRTS